MLTILNSTCEFLEEESFAEFLIRNFWRVKLQCIPVFLLSLCMSQDIVKIWMVRFSEPPVICQIRQGFPLPNSCDIQCFVLITSHVCITFNLFTCYVSTYKDEVIMTTIIIVSLLATTSCYCGMHSHESKLVVPLVGSLATLVCYSHKPLGL